MAKRRNKTYEQQKKFYDGSNNYESLGALFFDWLTCGNMTAEKMQEVYREGTKECKEYIIEDLFHLCRTQDLLSVYQNIQLWKEVNMERSANRGAHHVQAVRPHNINNLKERI